MKKFLMITILASISLTSENSLIPEDMREKKMDDFVKQKKDDELNKFIHHLGWKESRNRWHIINSVNCMGEYQFHPNTLKRLGYGHITADLFRADSSVFPPELQLKCMKSLIKIHEMELKPYENYFDSYVNEVYITKSGLLAGMHLGGLGSVKLFLTTNGKVDKSDGNGTKISDYIKEFCLYNL